jgi:hypothetical protein
MYIGAGLTHVAQPIRVDSLTVLNMWIDKFPKLFAKYSKEVIGQHDSSNVVVFTQFRVLNIQQP